MKVIELWKEYFNVGDEREEAEVNRITKRAFNALTALLIVFSYVLMQFSVVAEIHDLDDTPYRYLSIVASLLCLIVAACCIYIIKAQVNRGITGSARFVGVDRFPVGFGVRVALWSGIIVAILMAGARILVEIALAGVSEVYWLSDICIGLFFLPLVGFGVYVALYGTYRGAVKKQREILSQLEE